MANNSEILGEEAAVRQIITNNYTATDGHYEDDTVTEIRQSTFRDASGLTSASFPNVTKIAGNVFYNCSNLSQLSMPKLANITAGVSFRNVTSKLIFPLLTTIPSSSAFALARGTVIDAGFISSFGLATFQWCSNMIALILRKNAVVTYGAVNAFNDSKYAASGAGGAYVYVPRDLISTYQSATNWATLYAAHSDMFRALEDYTVDGTTTGDFDESKL